MRPTPANTERALDLLGDLVEDLHRRVHPYARSLQERRRGPYPSNVNHGGARPPSGHADPVGEQVTTPDPADLDWFTFTAGLDQAIDDLWASLKLMLKELGPDRVRARCQNPLTCPDLNMRPKTGHLLCAACLKHMQRYKEHRTRSAEAAQFDRDIITAGGCVQTGQPSV